jgi:hypothetical protein
LRLSLQKVNPYSITTQLTAHDNKTHRKNVHVDIVRMHISDNL